MQPITEGSMAQGRAVAQRSPEAFIAATGAYGSVRIEAALGAARLARPLDRSFSPIAPDTSWNAPASGAGIRAPEHGPVSRAIDLLTAAAEDVGPLVAPAFGDDHQSPAAAGDATEPFGHLHLAFGQ